VRLSKKFWKGAANIAIGANNLNDEFHSEGGSEEVPRQYYIQLFVNF
jgi:hypothetical protein